MQEIWLMFVEEVSFKLCLLALEEEDKWTTQQKTMFLFMMCLTYCPEQGRLLLWANKIIKKKVYDEFLHL